MLAKKSFMRDVTIYIPSCGRADKVYTTRSLSKRVLKNTHLVIPTPEFADYRKHNKGIQILSRPEKGIHEVRRWMIRNCPTRYLIMLDDDLKFGVRAKLGDWKIELITDPKPVDLLLEDVLRFVRRNRYAHASVSMRELGHPQKIAKLKDFWQYNERYTRFFLYDTQQLKEVKLGRVTVMEDFDIILQLLRAGKPCAISYKWVHGQAVGSNANGGCSTYRTQELQASCARKLARLHPEFVKVVEKKTKCAWGWGKRIDVVIAWKKAYASCR